MPIYEYKCPICAHTIERIEHISIKPHSPAPFCLNCGKAMERIQFSRPGEPAFKGTGFYKTDYKDKP